MLLAFLTNQVHCCLMVVEGVVFLSCFTDVHRNEVFKCTPLNY